MECLPAPGTVRLPYERRPEVPGAERQIECQQETGQGEPDDDVEAAHFLLYLLFWAVGIVVFRRVRVLLLWPEKLGQGDTLDPFWMTGNASCITIAARAVIYAVSGVC